MQSYEEEGKQAFWIEALLLHRIEKNRIEHNKTEGNGME